MMRPGWTYGGQVGEFRAGRIDARRTSSPRPWHGFRWGDTFYAMGYAAGCVR